jgi:hypothetical protein
MMSPYGIRGVHLGIFTVIAAFWLLVLSATASEWTPSFIDSAVSFLGACPYRRLTGQACPLCGGLGAFVCLLNGNLKTALSSNPIAVALAPSLLIQCFYRLFRIIKPAFRQREEIVVLTVGVLFGAALVA